MKWRESSINNDSSLFPKIGNNKAAMIGNNKAAMIGNNKAAKIGNNKTAMIGKTLDQYWT